MVKEQTYLEYFVCHFLLACLDLHQLVNRNYRVDLDLFLQFDVHLWQIHLDDKFTFGEKVAILVDCNHCVVTLQLFVLSLVFQFDDPDSHDSELPRYEDFVSSKYFRPIWRLQVELVGLKWLVFD